jgi:DNA segregation ATPase FtsK/SpoIIIE-like protein
MDNSTRCKLLGEALNALRDELIKIRNYLATTDGRSFDNTTQLFTEAEPEKDFFTYLAQEDEPLEESELLGQALKVITELGYASTIVLQHRLGINYRQAICLMYQLERDGLVEPAYGFRPRKALTAAYELEEQIKTQKLC